MLFTQSKNGRKFCRFEQTIRFTKAIIQELHSQAFATFGAACSQNCATTASFRANQEAVSAFAFGY